MKVEDRIGIRTLVDPDKQVVVALEAQWLW